MIKDKDFFDIEGGSLLLQRNNKFITAKNAATKVKEMHKFMDLMHSYVNKVILDDFEREYALENQVDYKNIKHVVHNMARIFDSCTDDKCKDEELLRIFKLDAERTFSADANREIMNNVLVALNLELKDYHQGVAYIVGYLLLYFTPIEVCKLVTALNRFYQPGYFKTASKAYFRDTKVLRTLVTDKYPDIAQHLDKYVPYEAFCSKLFIGLGIHVLTYDALDLLFEQLLMKGNHFLFQFALSIIDCCKDELLAADNPSKILEILRFEKTMYPDDKLLDGDPFFYYVIENAMTLSVEKYDFEKLRRDAEIVMAQEEHSRKEREAALDFESDIVFSDEEDE